MPKRRRCRPTKYYSYRFRGYACKEVTKEETENTDNFLLACLKEAITHYEEKIQIACKIHNTVKEENPVLPADFLNNARVLHKG